MEEGGGFGVGKELGGKWEGEIERVVGRSEHVRRDLWRCEIVSTLMGSSRDSEIDMVSR